MYKAKPTKEILAWQDAELGVLIHYLMEIYNPDFKEYKTAKVRTELAPERINPQHLDARQWVRAAYETGAKYAIIVANHCTGFSLWQTKVNDYGVASLKWKNGKGDLVRDFIDACREFGLKPGIYYSTGCNGYYDIDDSRKNVDYFSPEYQSYVKDVEEQVKELWTEYGELFEIWFDGGIIPVEKGGPDLTLILKKYQPNAVCFQGPLDYPHCIRWVGNENGSVPENCWATVDGKNKDAFPEGKPDGDYYCPAETDVPNRSNDAFGGGWAWKEGEKDKVLSPERLLECYINAVGRNTNLLLGMAINADGVFEDEEQFRSFGKLLKETFANPLAEYSGKEKTGFDFVINLPEKKPVKYVVIREDMTDGHNIRSFELLINGEIVYKGNCIGHKRIIPVDASAGSIELRITCAVEAPVIRDIVVY